MTLKTLFLGSAAVFTVGGAAQAADLSVAEPVEYVRVCDGFGAGYWVIPGTDTCLKIGGYVQVDTTFHDSASVWGGSGTHSAAWEMVTEASAQFSAKSMTEYGELAAYAEFRAQSNNSHDYENYTGKHLAYLDSAYLKLGALLAGSTASAYDYGGGFTIDGSDLDSDVTTDQIRLSWAAGGFGLALGIEDPRDRFGSDLDTEYSMPNIVGALTVSQANWDGQLSAGYAETVYGGGFGIQAAATFKLDSIAPGDQLRLKAAWAQSEVASFAASSTVWGGGYSGAYSGGSVWSALASFQHFWTPQLSSAVTFDYADADGFSAYQIYGNLVWAPVAGFMAGAEVGYNKSDSTDGAFSGKIRLKRSW
jgi:hypothetical protein